MRRLTTLLPAVAATSALAALLIQETVAARIGYGIAFIAMLAITVLLWTGDHARRRQP